MRSNYWTDSGCALTIAGLGCWSGIFLVVIIVCHVYDDYGLLGVLAGGIIVLLLLLLGVRFSKLARSKLAKALTKARNRDSALRKGTCPDCESPLQEIDSATRCGRTYPVYTQVPTGYTTRDGIVEEEDGTMTEFHHEIKYRCSSCGHEFIYSYTTSHREYRRSGYRNQKGTPRR